MIPCLNNSQNGWGHTGGEEIHACQSLGKEGRWGRPLASTEPGDQRPVPSSLWQVPCTLSPGLGLPLPCSPRPCGVSSLLRKVSPGGTKSHRKNAVTFTTTARKVLPASGILYSLGPGSITQTALLLGLDGSVLAPAPHWVAPPCSVHFQCGQQSLKGGGGGGSFSEMSAFGADHDPGVLGSSPTLGSLLGGPLLLLPDSASPHQM